MKPSHLHLTRLATPVLMLVAVAIVTSAASAQEQSFLKQMRAQPVITSSPSKQETELPADGTWREEGQDLILNFNGQTLRLRKSPSTVTDEPRASGSPSSRDVVAPGRRVNPVIFATQSLPQASPSGGTIVGRLMNRGRPLANCEVSLIPMKRNFLGFRSDDLNEPPLTTTDADGRYRFENLPVGPYKLRWRPQGEEAWIRRIEFRPDVTVKTDETARIREIRTALRTLN